MAKDTESIEPIGSPNASIIRVILERCIAQGRRGEREPLLIGKGAERGRKADRIPFTEEEVEEAQRKAELLHAYGLSGGEAQARDVGDEFTIRVPQNTKFEPGSLSDRMGEDRYGLSLFSIQEPPLDQWRIRREPLPSPDLHNLIYDHDIHLISPPKFIFDDPDKKIVKETEDPKLVLDSNLSAMFRRILDELLARQAQGEEPTPPPTTTELPR